MSDITFGRPKLIRLLLSDWETFYDAGTGRKITENHTVKGWDLAQELGYDVDTREFTDAEWPEYEQPPESLEELKEMLGPRWDH